MRACWAALWSTRALRYMATHDLDPADTAMAVLVQPLVAASAAGGGLSQTADGGMLLINATWGLGSSIAQGEVTPDRYELTPRREAREVASPAQARTTPRLRAHCASPRRQRVRRAGHAVPRSRAGGGARRDSCGAGRGVMGMPVEIEWALDERGIQAAAGAAAAHLQPAPVPRRAAGCTIRASTASRPASAGRPGRARVVNCECELVRVGARRRARDQDGRARALRRSCRASRAWSRSCGGSTSHLASLARERGIPMVLGAFDATHAYPTARWSRWMGSPA